MGRNMSPNFVILVPIDIVFTEGINYYIIGESNRDGSYQSFKRREVTLERISSILFLYL